MMPDWTGDQMAGVGRRGSSAGMPKWLSLRDGLPNRSYRPQTDPSRIGSGTSPRLDHSQQTHPRPQSSLCWPPWRLRFAMSETRKIAASLDADVVGYSRLAGTDEERTVVGVGGTRARSARVMILSPSISRKPTPCSCLRRFADSPARCSGARKPPSFSLVACRRASWS